MCERKLNRDLEMVSTCDVLEDNDDCVGIHLFVLNVNRSCFVKNTPIF